MMLDELREVPVPYRIWGKEHIDKGSFDQMDAAARLPVALMGALMPDAHVGYGLPIGGILAARDAVIPYAVGVDIACRMRMTLFSVSPIVIRQKPAKFESALVDQTIFGAGGMWPKNQREEHEVLDDPDWQATGFLRHLRDLATAQLGTSGSSNHFVEWGAFKVMEEDGRLGLKPGEYLALLSHSGSRGVGYQIAERYSNMAMAQHPTLHQSVKHLAWLPIQSELGQEYWISMQMAGKFAAANHEMIHRRIARAAGLKAAAVIENHHNFAWKEFVPDPENPGEQIEAFVHRKGATPAGKGVLGVIPGSMGDAGYVVRGRGSMEALNSASHGAGRVMSRNQAFKSITKTERDRYLKTLNVKLIGGGLDEAPQAYKKIDDVIAAQSGLVEVIGKFTPMIVRMDDGKGKRHQKGMGE